MKFLKLVALVTLFFNNTIINNIKTSYYQDLVFMYECIKENHPGMYNIEDPQFKEIFENSYRKAQKTIAATSNLSAQEEAINSFIKSFDDVHMQIGWYTKHRQCDQKLHKSVTIKIDELSDTAWITLPTFDLNQDQQKEFEIMLQVLPRCRHKRTLVFDLRTNDGGNSDYGSQIIDSLFGQEYAQQKRKTALEATYIDWRASKTNINHIQSLLKKTKGETHIFLEKLAIDMQKTFEQGMPYYRESPKKMAHKASFHHDITAKIIVIIDQHNMSAALDFIDELKYMEYPILLVGKTTKADSLYMEIQVITLPSGLGCFAFPIKVYKNRPRSDRVPYSPDFECETQDNKPLDFITCLMQTKAI